MSLLEPGARVKNAPILASDGRALIVAMDHARTHGAVEGLEARRPRGEGGVRRPQH